MVQGGTRQETICRSLGKDSRMNTTLAHFNKAKQELALATSVDEVKEVRDKAEALRMYTKQQGESLEMQNQCAEIKLRAERRAGEILEDMPKNKGVRLGGNVIVPPGGEPKLEDIGISKNQSSQWQKIASLPEDVFENHIEETKANKGELTTVGTLRLLDKPHVSHATGENEWYTTPELIQSVKDVLGEIDCDPASSEIANRTVRAKEFYTKEDDGLKQKWGRRVFLNPPYAQPLISQFADTLVSKVLNNEISAACVLVNNATETKWFNAILGIASAVCFIKGRVRFLDKTGNPTGSPLQGQAMLYIGEEKELFAEKFIQFGSVLFHA